MPSRTDPNSLAFTDEVLTAWREVVEWNRQGKPAAASGTGSIAELRDRLRPIREGFRDEAQRCLSEVAAYSHLKVYLSAFWQRSPKGARLKDRIWNFSAPSRRKTDGRLQFTLGPVDDVYTEYVSYSKMEANVRYHIEDISKRIRHGRYFETLRAGLEALPNTFHLDCTTSTGTVLSGPVQSIAQQDWRELREAGLDVSCYFIVSRHYHFPDIESLTVAQVAALWANDLVELSGLYPLLQGVADKVGNIRRSTMDPAVAAVRQLEAERAASVLSHPDLTNRALRATESQGSTGPGRYYSRDPHVAAYVKRCAAGRCDLCRREAPFIRTDKQPYLESHHVVPRGSGGIDGIGNVVALCPNCHREIHHLKPSKDVASLALLAQRRLRDAERSL